MLLAGLGIGALASQLGSVTVSSVSDEQSGEVGGLQNTVTNLGASIGTALAGAVLIAALSSVVPRRAFSRTRPCRRRQIQGRRSSWPAGCRSCPTPNCEAPWRRRGLAAGDRCDRRRERDRAPDGAALVAVGAGGDRADRAAAQPRHPDRAAGRGAASEAGREARDRASGRVNGRAGRLRFRARRRVARRRSGRARGRARSTRCRTRPRGS